MDYSNIVESVSEVTLIAPDTGSVIALVLAALLLVCSAFASGSEIAVFGLSPSDISELDPDHSDVDRKIVKLREDSERTLATILITNNLVNVSIIMLCNYSLGHIIHFGNARWLEFLCITVILTFLLLLFGEIMPKVYSRQNPLRFCRKVAGGLTRLNKLLKPFSAVLMSSGVLAEKVPLKDNHKLSVGELEHALELTDKDEIKDEKSMLQGIIRFGDETAKEVMTSRQDVVDLDIRSTYDEVLRSIIDNNYSRIPVYQDNTDNIRGRALYQGSFASSFQACQLPLAEPYPTAILCA